MKKTIPVKEVGYGYFKDAAGKLYLSDGTADHILQDQETGELYTYTADELDPDTCALQAIMPL